MSKRQPRRWLRWLRDPDPPYLWRIGYALAACFLIAVAALAVLWVAALGLLHARVPNAGALSVHDAVGVAQLVFASVAGAGALVALVVAYRRQRVAETASSNDRVRVFNERFTAIASQLGDRQAAVRLAGVHTMAGLADDWEENRQTCVDVLCAYLRMPYEADPGDQAPAAKRLEFQAEKQVRHTVIRLITAHLQDSTATSWHGLNFDFTGTRFDGGDFTAAGFSGGTVSFSGAVFSGGTVSFDRAVFSGGRVSFSGAVFSGGAVSFYGAVFSGGRVSFSGAVFSGGRVSFDATEFSGSEVSFRGAVFSGGHVHFEPVGSILGGVLVLDRYWSHPPTFSFSGAPPNGLTLPAGWTP